MAAFNMVAGLVGVLALCGSGQGAGLARHVRSKSANGHGFFPGSVKVATHNPNTINLVASFVHALQAGLANVAT
jgi:hypothetical protein